MSQLNLQNAGPLCELLLFLAAWVIGLSIALGTSRHQEHARNGFAASDKPPADASHRD